MKRLLPAVSFAVLAVPAAAAGLPYDQNLVDRALPQIEQPELRTERQEFAAAAGSTRSDVEISADKEAANVSNGSGLASGPWANDYHFIAPAQ
ncbi:MAG TPA: hypothetical protein VHG88_10385 [Burkholderiales bacterium]|nr:hypothetical protein [Burkholderiales bacterium]